MSTSFHDAPGATRGIRRLAVLAGLAAALVAPLAQAQAPYPSKPIRLVVPFAAGGSTDILARIVGQKLTERIGTSVVIDNRPGANGTLGCDLVAKAPADGYTLVMADIGCFAMAPGLYPKLPYEPVRDFVPVTLVARSPLVLTVGAGSPVQSVRELVTLARSKPGQLNFPSSGNGGPNHLAGELFKIQADVKTVHVPYKGSAPSVVALVAGETDFGFLTSVTISSQLSAGKLRALAVASEQRLASLPNVPTMGEAGLPGFEAESWFMVAVPAGTPRPIVDKLNAEVIKILPDPETKDKLNGMGAVAVGNTPDAALDFLKAEIAKWGRVIKAADIKLDQ